MAGTPTAPGDRDDLGARPVREQMVVADRGQAEVGAVVGDAEDEARKARRRDAGDGGSCGRPARFDEQTDPDRTERQAEGRLGAVEEVVEQRDLLGMFDLGKDDPVEREGAATAPARGAATAACRGRGPWSRG